MHRLYFILTPHTTRMPGERAMSHCDLSRVDFELIYLTHQLPTLHYFEVFVADIRRNQEGRCSLLGPQRALCDLGIVWESTHDSYRNKRATTSPHPTRTFGTNNN